MTQQAQTLTRLSDNLTLKNVTASGTSLTIGKQYISQSTALDLTGAVTDADGTPYTITALAQRAFIGYKLAAVTLPDGLQSIGEEAFRGCSELTAIDIPASVTSIGEDAFYDCTSLTAVTLPDGLESIGNRAFCVCSALTSIDIPASVTSIGENAFNGCTSLTDVTLPDGLQSIGDNAFRGCSELTSIDIPCFGDKYRGRRVQRLHQPCGRYAARRAAKHWGRCVPRAAARLHPSISRLR